MRVLRDAKDWQDAEQRFWEMVNKTEDCWLWTGAFFKRGYGSFSWQGIGYRAHRVSFELAYGKPADGLFLDHICHVPGCVRPDHLRPVTNKQNMENYSGHMSTNTSGVRGVSWFPKARKWRAQVAHNKRVIHVGLFSDIRDAEAAVVAKRNDLHTHNDLDRAS